MPFTHTGEEDGAGGLRESGSVQQKVWRRDLYCGGGEYPLIEGFPLMRGLPPARQA